MNAVLTHRRSDGAVALAVAAAAVIWLAAFVSPVSADGANGTVKIHDAPDHKNGSVMANDPKVCNFTIHGFGFDASQTGGWWIQEHKWGSGDSSQAVLSGSYQADGNGDWSEPDGTNAHDSSHAAWFTLDPGHYKLYVEAKEKDGKINYKHKVFKVECAPSGGGTQQSTPTPTPTPTPVVTPTPTPPPGGGGQQGATPTPTPTPTPTAAAGGGGQVAAGGQSRGGVLGSQGGPGAGSLPNTAVPLELAGSIGGLLVVLSGIGYSLNRRRGH